MNVFEVSNRRVKMSRLGIDYPNAEIFVEAHSKVTELGWPSDLFMERSKFHFDRLTYLRECNAPLMVIQPVDRLVEVFSVAAGVQKARESIAETVARRHARHQRTWPRRKQQIS